MSFATDQTQVSLPVAFQRYQRIASLQRSKHFEYYSSHPRSLVDNSSAYVQGGRVMTCRHQQITDEPPTCTNCGHYVCVGCGAELINPVGLCIECDEKDPKTWTFVYQVVEQEK